MTRPPAKPPAPDALPADLPSLRGAPYRLAEASHRHTKALNDLTEINTRLKELNDRVQTAQWEKSQAQRKALIEQTTRREPERGPTVTVIGPHRDNPSVVGIMQGGDMAQQGVEYGNTAPPSAALSKLTAASQALDTLQALLNAMTSETVPAATQRLASAKAALEAAQSDVDRLDAVKAAHASPALKAADDKFSAAAAALEAARLENLEERERLVGLFGADPSFDAAKLAPLLPPGVAKLVPPVIQPTAPRTAF